MKKLTHTALWLLLTVSASGCATTSTLSQPFHKGVPVVMSGTRLDIGALRGDARLKNKFGVSPPDYPLLDLPLSATLDALFIGYSVTVALFRKATHR